MENITGKNTKFCQERNTGGKVQSSRKTSELWVCGEKKKLKVRFRLQVQGYGGVIIIYIGRAFFKGRKVSISALIIHTYHHHHYHFPHQVQQSG